LVFLCDLLEMYFSKNIPCENVNNNPKHKHRVFQISYQSTSQLNFISYISCSPICPCKSGLGFAPFIEKKNPFVNGFQVVMEPTTHLNLPSYFAFEKAILAEKLLPIIGSLSVPACVWLKYLQFIYKSV